MRLEKKKLVAIEEELNCQPNTQSECDGELRVAIALEDVDSKENTEVAKVIIDDNTTTPTVSRNNVSQNTVSNYSEESVVSCCLKKNYRTDDKKKHTSNVSLGQIYLDESESHSSDIDSNLETDADKALETDANNASEASEAASIHKLIGSLFDFVIH